MPDRHFVPSKGIATVKTLLDAGKFVAAENLAGQLRSKNPDNIVIAALYARCAVERKDWPEAVLRWSHCRDAFPGQQAVWRPALANALLQCLRLPEAVSEFRAWRAHDPDCAAASLGLAKALGPSNPDEAEAVLDDLFRNTPTPHPMQWIALRCGQLERAGKYSEAATVYAGLIGNADANQPELLTRYARLLRRANLREKARDELDVGLLREVGAASPADRLTLYLWFGERAPAHRCFEAAVREAGTVVQLTTLLELLPQAYEGYAREQKLRELRARIIDLQNRSEDQVAWQCLRLRLDVALRDQDALVRRYRNATALSGPWSFRFKRLAQILGAERFPDLEAPKVFGIGLSKTGTSSLGAALERLGYLHAHFTNPFSAALVEERDFLIFDAVTDTPAACRFELLYHMFPNARFILTERPYEPWEKSFRSHFQRNFGTSDFGELARRATDPENTQFTGRIAANHFSLYFRYSDPRSAHEVYMRRVEHFFADKPAGKLLRFNVFAGDGWPELCRFLGHNIPREPFPWVNRAAAAGSGNMELATS